MKHIYTMGLKNQGISEKDILPHLRVGLRISQYRACTQRFLSLTGLILALRVRRPTVRALTKGFLGTAKREKIRGTVILTNIQPVMSSLRFIHSHHNERLHQGLWNFAPFHIHEINNKTVLLEELAELKRQSRLA